MFQFPGFASGPYVFRYGYRRSGGFPHSEILGSKLVCQLPEAYRRLPRPSSPVAAKASTVCAYSLDHITPKGLESLAGKNATYPFEQASRPVQRLLTTFQIVKELIRPLAESETIFQISDIESRRSQR